jgi:predicted MPP superfamily phosphohydrolase
LFAPEGWGKTACRRMIEYVCENKINMGENIFCISYDHNDLINTMIKFKNILEYISIDQYSEIIINEVISRVGHYEAKHSDKQLSINNAIEVIKSSGFNCVFILVDNIDKLTEFNKEDSIKFILRLIDIAKNFNSEGVYFKFFLPTELQERLNQYSYFKTFEKVELKWEGENKKIKFKEIIQGRLNAATKKDLRILIRSLSEASGGRLTVQLEDFLINKANSPRELIKYCDKILNIIKEFPQNKRIPDKILAQIFPHDEYDKYKIGEPDTQTQISIQSNIVNILHISDIHIQTSSDAQLFQNQLLTDLVKNLKIENLDYIIITGDIAKFSTEEEYKYANEFIDNIKKHFNLKSEKVIICPGNHDLNRDLSKRSYINFFEDNPENIPEGQYVWIKDDKSANTICLRNEKLHRDRFCFFSDFYKKISANPYSLNYEDQGNLHSFSDDKVVFLTLNSCWEIDHIFKDRASIHNNALTNQLNILLKNESNYHNYLKIALWHHPINMMKNNNFIKKILANYNFHICMYGHIHEDSNGLFSVYEPNLGIHFVGAGTFGSPGGETLTGVPHQYNLLLFDKHNKKLTVKTRRKKEGIWTDDNRWGDIKNPLSHYQIDLSTALVRRNERV